MNKTKSATEKRAPSKAYVLVTTERRGVFAGVMKRDRGATVVLTDGRNCIYWTREVKGFLGLAVTGPLAGSRIGPAVPELTLHGVTSISICTPEARKAWEAAPWK